MTDTITLPVRWEQQEEDDGFIVLRVGTLEVGYIESQTRRGETRWRSKITPYAATFHPTREAAMAAALAALGAAEEK